MRTLVISDLHLGSQAQHDVLRQPAPLATLLDALAGVDRLVLLGDLVELITRHPRRSLAASEPVLRAIGERMSDREILVVPGNHDAPLVRAWTRAQGRGLAVDAAVDRTATRALARITGWVGPGQVRVHYPGAWLDERTYVTHGHYLDHHLLPESPIGLPRGGFARHARGPALPFDYEQGRIRSHHGRDTQVGQAMQRLLTGAVDGVADVVRATLLEHLPRLLRSARLTPLSAAAVDVQMRHAALPAMARVIAALGVQAEWVIFGHVHRLGPLAPDRAERWRADGGPRLLNSGSWLYEPMLVDRASPPHPYWPGGAVALEPGRDPTVVSLLDGLDRGALRPR